MTKRIYLTQPATIEGRKYEPNSVYTFDAAQSDKLIEQGVAEVLNLGTIGDIETKADKIADDYTAKRKELLESERYNDNESERSFLLTQLEVETQKAIEDVEFDYQAELMASKKYAASEALKPIGTPEEVAQAAATANAIQTQLLIASNPREVIEMLRLSAEGFDDATKIEVLKVLPAIKEQAGASHQSTLQDIEKDLRRFASATDHQRNLRHLQAVERSTGRVTMKYHNAKLLQGGKS